MLVLYAAILIVFWPDLVRAGAWVRETRARGRIRRQAREACELLDLEYELLLHTHR